ncbi:MAG: primosomal protein N' [Eubacterium sp.]|nr:primosomal protein N' [Eubacterium sp.]
MYVNLAIDTKSRYMDSLYTYAAPDDTAVGDVFIVPFNKNNRERLGYVFETNVEPVCDESQIKSVARRVEEYSLNTEMMKTIAWMRTRYGIKYIDAIHCFIPPGKPAKPGREKRPYKDMVPEEQNIDRLTDEQNLAVAEINAAMDQLAAKCNTTDSREQNSDSQMPESIQDPAAVQGRMPAAVQEQEAERDSAGSVEPANQYFLLKGVTSSGKTEVYMRAIEHALEFGRTAIMLVPEIALTKQVIERFAGRFGREQIAVLHSHLTQRERFDEWMRLRRGEARIAIGARIGVFAPLDDIGVIIMDEEHESTYKSDQTPKYETVDIAVKRLMTAKGVLVLGSATPSVVSYERAREGVYKLIELKKRFNETLLPEVRIVDMREELKRGNRGIFSSALAEEMQATLEKGKQVILFMNRRGYSTYVQCRDCGEPLKCPECGITLVYHKNYRAAGKYAAQVNGAGGAADAGAERGAGAAVCHYCGRAYEVPSACPSCGGRELRYMGTGTEKVQELAQQMFPEAVVDRLDLDTAKSTKEINRIIGDFSKKKTDILVGTQLVAKGLDFDSVGLVGIISADVSLNIPGYRSTERTYQLVTQAAGRSGRGEERGRVIIQTFTPDNFALIAAKNSSYEDFFEKEIKFRQMMDYPPFTDLIAAEFTSDDEQKAIDAAEECRNYLIRAGLPAADRIFAPRLTEAFKGQEGYRYHILIKSPKDARNKYIYYLSKFGDKMVNSKRGVAMTIDVNPYSTF